MVNAQKICLAALAGFSILACDQRPIEPEIFENGPVLFSSIPVGVCPADQTLVEANGFEPDDRNGDGWICLKTNGAGKVMYADNNVNSTPGERPIDRLPTEAANGVLHSCLDQTAYPQLPVRLETDCANLCSAVIEAKCSIADCQQVCVVAGGTLGITIDATAVTSVDFTVRNVGTYPTSDPVTLNLEAGNFQVQANEGSVKFAVTLDGLVEYDPVLEGILEGAGTSALTINGATVTMTAPLLSSGPGDYTVLKVGTFPTDAVASMNVLPGLKRIQATEGGVALSVSNEGTFEYDPVLEGIVEGGGTQSLIVNGAPILVDATGLAGADYMILNVGLFPAAVPATIRVLPGNKRFRSADIDFDFQVNTTGNLNYDYSLDGVLAGRGSTTLTVTP